MLSHANYFLRISYLQIFTVPAISAVSLQTSYGKEVPMYSPLTRGATLCLIEAVVFHRKPDLQSSVKCLLNRFHNYRTAIVEFIRQYIEYIAHIHPSASANRLDASRLAKLFGSCAGRLHAHPQSIPHSAFTWRMSEPSHPGLNGGRTFVRAVLRDSGNLHPRRLQ